MDTDTTRIITELRQWADRPWSDGAEIMATAASHIAWLNRRIAIYGSVIEAMTAAEQQRAQSIDTVMITDVLFRLDRFGCYRMNEEGQLSDWEQNPMATDAANVIRYLMGRVAECADGHHPTA